MAFWEGEFQWMSKKIFMKRRERQEIFSRVIIGHEDSF